MNFPFIFAIVSMMVLNRAAGNDLFGLKPVLRLPGKPLLWVLLPVGMVVWSIGPLQSVTLAPWLLVALGWLPDFVGEWIAGVLLSISPYRLLLACVLAFYFWRVWEVGEWIDLNTLPEGYNRVGQAPTFLRRVISALAFQNDRLALFYRHLFLTPGMGVIYLCGGPLWLLAYSPVFALALTGCHIAALGLLFPRQYHWLAECLQGLVWAVVFSVVGGAL